MTIGEDLVDYRLEGNVGVMVFDDGKANVLSPDSIGAIHAALDRASKEAAAVALFGRPGRFSGGFDLAIMGSDPESMRSLVGSGIEMMLRIWEFPRPVVMGCTGHAVAAGAMLLLTADYRVGMEGDWKIGLNESQIGMPLPIFTVEIARDRLAPTSFTRAALHGDMYDGAGAVSVGYLDEVVPPEKLIETTMAQASRLAALAPSGYGVSKARARAALAEQVRATLATDLGTISPPAS